MSDNYMHFELTLARTSNPDTAMKEFILERGNHISGLVSLLTFDWQAASLMMNRLVDHVSMWITADGEPVVFKIVDKALRCYKEAVYNTSQPKRDDPDRLIVFLDALISETVAAGCFVVKDKRRARPDWTVASAVPFPTWVGGRGEEMEIVKVDHGPMPGIHLTLYELLTDNADRSILRRYGYEATSVAGSDHPSD